jgi:hypothetical protein
MKGGADPSCSGLQSRRYTAELESHWNHPVETATKVVIMIVVAIVIFNLGQTLFFMMKGSGDSDRVVKALTRRIALSLLAIVLVIISIWAGWIHPHGVGG